VRRWLSQCAAVTRLNLLTLPQRLGSSAASVFGIGLVVAVFVAVLSIAEGFKRTLETTGGPGNVIVLRAGTDTEMNSILGRRSTQIVSDGPGIERDADGHALASAELLVIVDLPRRSSSTPANVPLRGVSAQALAVRGNVRIVEGRAFESGRNEIIVGAAAAAEFAGLDVGNVLHWGDKRWTVVGRFTAGGTLAESELWTDAGVLAPAYQRGNTYQSIYAKLDSPASFARFKDALTGDPRLDVAVLKENEYYASQSRLLVGIVQGLGGIIAGLMGVGAIFGAVNTMYTAVSARTREIATLRALGFSSSPVLVSVLIESLTLATVGGTLGALAAWAAFDGYKAATLNWQSFSQVAFAFAVTPRLLVQGLVYSLIMGLIGGLLPAIRAARLPVSAALREQ
jgi:putative ABC transport system permease protein